MLFLYYSRGVQFCQDRRAPQSLPTYISSRLDSSGEANLRVRGVKDGVVLADEDVTENVEAARGESVEAHEAREALALHLQHVVLGLEVEGLASELDVDRREGVDLGAVDGVLVADEDLLDLLLRFFFDRAHVVIKRR